MFVSLEQDYSAVHDSERFQPSHCPYDPQPVVAFLKMLDHGAVDGVTEIRILSKDPYTQLHGRRIFTGKTIVGYYEPGEYSRAAADIAPFDGKAQIYVCLNPCKPELLARCANRLQFNAPHTAKDADILCLQWFRVDCDPVRPSGISSSDEELKLALQCRDEIADELEQGSTQVIRAMSGNGGHLLVRLPDYPNDEKHCGLIEAVTKDLSQRWSSDLVTVDTTVTNPARIWKVYGTLAVKGDDIASRPHRRATIEIPAVPITPFDLRALELCINDSEISNAFDDDSFASNATNKRDGHPYALSALTGEAAKVRSAPDGQKHKQVLSSARALGGFVPSGALTPQQIETELFDAVRDRADDKQQAHKTIQDGIRYGMSEPRSLPTEYSRNGSCADTPVTVRKRQTNQTGGARIQFESSPQPLIELLRPVPKLSPEMLPAPLRCWLIDIAERMSCPLEFAAIPALIGLTSLIGRKVAIRPKRYDDWQTVANLWGAIIGLPSALKTPAASEALRPLKRLAAQAHEDYLKEMKDYQAKKQESQSKQQDGGIGEEPAGPIERRYIVNDATVPALGQRLAENPNGLLLNRDELMGWLKSMEKENAEADRPFYLQAWNGTEENYVYDRVGRGTLHIPQLCISLFGTIQPGPLAQYVRATRGGTGDDGLMQRMQLLVYPDPVAWRNVDRYPDTKAKNRAYAIYEKADILHPDQIHAQHEDGVSIPFLRFADDAYEFFVVWRTELETKKLQNNMEIPAIKSHLAKYRSLLPSLALIFHIIDFLDGVETGPAISLRCVEQAAAWCDYLEEHMRRVYLADDEINIQSAQTIAERLSQLPHPFTAYDITRRGWRGLKQTEDVNLALCKLEERHWVKGVDVCAPAGEKGGRSTRRFYINPAVLDQEAV